MTFYIGRFGALVALPTPVRGRQQPWSRQSATHDTLGGGRRVQFAPDGRRVYAWSWKFLSTDLVSALERFATGAAGPGPYVLVDPERRNMLSRNQSSAGSAAGDSTGVSAVDSSETVGVQSTVYLQGPRTLVWHLPHTVVSGRLVFDPPAGLPGFAAPPGEPWMFSAWVQGGGADPLSEVTAVLRWVRADGSGTSETAGTPVSAHGNGWTQVSVGRVTPPPDAAGFIPELRITPGSVVAAASGLGMTRQGTRHWATWRTAAVYPAVSDWVFGSTVDLLVDMPQLDMHDTVRTWNLGTGMPQVSWLELPDQYNLVNMHDVQATLAEVG